MLGPSLAATRGAANVIAAVMASKASVVRTVFLLFFPCGGRVYAPAIPAPAFFYYVFRPEENNFRNELLQAGGSTGVYDGDGNRVSETVGGVTTRYLIDAKNPRGLPRVMDELQNGAVTRTYAYGLQRISENQQIAGVLTPAFGACPPWRGYDGHGSVGFLTTMAGAISDTYTFDTFGNELSSTGSTPNNYLFAGEQYDPSLGFYYTRARYYRSRTLLRLRR